MKKFAWILVLVFIASLIIWGFALSQEKPKTPAPGDTAKKEVTKPATGVTSEQKITEPAKADTTKKVVKEHAYVGAGKCKMCHNTPAWGKIYDKWSATKHFTAYTTLANEQSKGIAKGLKIEDAQKSAKCLVCHVTGYDAPAKLKGEKLTLGEGVSCEACHGPAGDYLTSHIKKDKALAKADGLILPTEALSKQLCEKCHNKQSPTFKEFKYKEAVKLVEHHKPTPEELKKQEEAKGK
jgi:hypothetical protein